jgi:hypothetical protein
MGDVTIEVGDGSPMVHRDAVTLLVFVVATGDNDCAEEVDDVDGGENTCRLTFAVTGRGDDLIGLW